LSRSIVVLQAGDSTPDLAPTLATHAWRSRRATHPDQVLTSLESEKCHVGIAVFDAGLPCSPKDFAEVVEDSGMEWIAILPPRGTSDQATARALCSSYFDYHTLPIDPARLLYSVGHAHGKALLRQSAATPIEPTEGRYGMIGKSPSMLALFGELEKIIRSTAPVFITGESGVGKELAARAVHWGSRNGGPFVPVNCGALPDQLIESLLFGHEKGAFTGAHERRIGSIEAADQGTIFLDEIGDLPRAAQASLLRFLQESTVMRVGSTREMHIDTRVIAATHMDLEAAVRAGRFREDLFYRLNVLNVAVPPLRDRGDDCLVLAEHFFRTNATGKAPGVHGFSRDALKIMQQHSWPGNVRELLNRVQRAMVMCEGSLVTPKDLQLGPVTGTARVGSLASAREGIERLMVEEALVRNDYNIAATARDLRISRVTLYRLLGRLRIGAKGHASAETALAEPIVGTLERAR
jgi:DNA-binding NtrC family response regulator